MTRFLVWGGGGHGKVVADLIRATGGELVGFADGDRTKCGREVEPGGGRVIIHEDELIAALALNTLPAGADAIALAIGDNRTRLQRFRLLRGAPAPALVHPTAVVSPSARIGYGTVVFARAVINADASLGEAVIVNTGAIVEHDVVVGDGAHIAPNAALGGGVRLGDRCWVGIGATVIHLAQVGADTRIGAGAAVVSDVPEGETVVGVPARSIRSRISEAARAE